MRRKHLSILFALPTANALSLANFQQITSIVIPLSCQLAYDGQIPSCKKSDFNNGCSAACIAGLDSVADDVSDACSSVSVSPNTLLGIVMNGGIVAALCPTLAQTTSTVLRSTTTAPIAISNTPALSVTIPTDSQGNTGGLGFKTTTSTKSTSSIPTPQSIMGSTSEQHTSSGISVTVKSTSTETKSTSSSSSASLSSADGGLGGGPPPTITTTTTSSSSSKKGSVASSTSSATPKPASQPDTGGGSPFDISSGGSRIGGDSVLGLVIMVVACVLTGR